MKKTTTVLSRQTPAKKMAAGTNAQSSEQGQTSTAASNQQGSLLEKLFTDMLKDIYWAEEHLIGALQTLKEAATSEELQDAFEDHLYATQKHKTRLEKVFQLIGEEATGKKCDAMAGLVKEAESLIRETKEGTMTRDAALIIAAQKVEHYEIASYGSLVQLALTLGHDKAAELLQKTLWEEEDTDQLLTDIAESDINPLADEETDGDSGAGAAEEEEDV